VAKVILLASKLAKFMADSDTGEMQKLASIFCEGTGANGVGLRKYLARSA